MWTHENSFIDGVKIIFIVLYYNFIFIIKLLYLVIICVHIFSLIKYIMVRRNRTIRRKTRRAGVKAGRTYKNLVGTRAEVMHGTAFKTSYGKTKSQGGDALTKRDYMNNKHGRIVSVEKGSSRKSSFLNSFVMLVTFPKKVFSAIKTKKINHQKVTQG